MVILKYGVEVMEFPISELAGDTIIGRHPGAHIQLEAYKLGLFHAVIRKRDGKLYAEALDVEHGMLLDRKKIKTATPAPLRDGSLVDIPGSHKSPAHARRSRGRWHLAGRHWIARLMRDNDLKARQRRRFKKTTGSNHGGPVAPNHLDQDFAATAPDQKWAAGISYVWTAEGWLYLAIVLDLYSRRIAGWAVSDRLKKRSGAFRIAADARLASAKDGYFASF
jgi:FHA domain